MLKEVEEIMYSECLLKVILDINSISYCMAVDKVEAPQKHDQDFFSKFAPLKEGNEVKDNRGSQICH